MSDHSAGDAGDGLVYVFYNYHSVPIPRDSIESLIRFVTSQLSFSLIRFFFCCDVRLTTSEILDSAHFIPSCQVDHFNFDSPNDLEQSIGNRMTDYSNRGCKGPFALVSGPGEYANLFERLGPQLSFFHPSGIDPSLLNMADLCFELPKTLEIGGSAQKTSSKMHLTLQRLNAHLNKAIDFLVNFFPSPEIREEDIVQPTNPLGVWAKGPPGAKSGMVSSGPGPSENNNSSTANNNSYEDDYKKADGSRDRQEQPFVAQQSNVKEKKNPFEKPNPFQQRNPFTSCDSRDSPMREEEPKPFGRGQRNPFASPFSSPFGSSSSPRGGFSSNKPIEANGPFRKLTSQCPHWEVHRNNERCPLWHPQKPCSFFPKCRLMAAECVYAHPFCTDGECACHPNRRDPQLNHFNAQ